MEAYTVCQSCGMPLDRLEVAGTEKDGSKSLVYCRYCYNNGQFTNPGITLAEMKLHLIGLMNNTNMDKNAIAKVLDKLPYLNRWRGKS